MTKSESRPRVAALVGPYLSGKTSLLEEIIRQCGALDRKGSVKDGNMVGDNACASSTAFTASTSPERMAGKRAKRGGRDRRASPNRGV